MIALPLRTSQNVSWVAVACLVLAITAGVLAAFQRLPLTLVVAPIGVASLVFFARRPELAVALLPAIGAAVPYSIGTGSQSPIVSALVVAIGVVVLGLLRAVRSEDWRTGSAVTVPAIALMLVWVFSLLWSNVDMSPLVTSWSSFLLAQIGGTGVAVISAGVLLVAQRVGQRGPWIEVSTWVMLACGVAAFFAYLVGQQNNVTSALETGGLFTMWVIALSLGQALFNDRLHWLVRLGLLALAVAWEVKAALLQTWWFSGWLPPLLVAMVLVLLRSRRLFAIIAVVATGVLAVRFDSLYAAVWGSTVEKGDLSRLDIWQQTFDLFGRHPILGTGPAGYAVYFQSLYAGSSFSMSTHNNYLDVLAETGIVGSLVFVWLLLSLVVVGWKARSRWQSGFEGAYAHSAFAALFGLIVAMAMGDWFIPFVYNQTIAGFRFTVHSWVFLGFMAALAWRPKTGADTRAAMQKHVAMPHPSRSAQAVNRAARPAQP